MSSGGSGDPIAACLPCRDPASPLPLLCLLLALLSSPSCSLRASSHCLLSASLLAFAAACDFSIWLTFQGEKRLGDRPLATRVISFLVGGAPCQVIHWLVVSCLFGQVSLSGPISCEQSSRASWHESGQLIQENPSKGRYSCGRLWCPRSHEDTEQYALRYSDFSLST